VNILILYVRNCNYIGNKKTQKILISNKKSLAIVHSDVSLKFILKRVQYMYEKVFIPSETIRYSCSSSLFKFLLYCSTGPEKGLLLILSGCSYNDPYNFQ
jgi:hypothetical protein